MKTIIKSPSKNNNGRILIMANSFLEPNGLFNPALRFAFTNISDDVFTSYWDKVPIVVKPYETIEISSNNPIPGVTGQALAVKMTCELVDKIMIGEAKMDEMKHKEPYFRSPKGSSLGVPAARKLWEDKILRELGFDEESPAIKTMRNQLKEEILSGGDKNRVQDTPMPSSVQEFADLTKKETPVVKKAVRVKKIKNETVNSNGNTKE